MEVFGKKAGGRYEKTTLEDQGKDVGCVWKNLLATETARQKKNKLNNKIKTVCCKCKLAVCAKHPAVTYQKCHEENA